MKKYSKVKRDAIDHYNRMIEWAEGQPKRGSVDNDDMNNAIDEDWFSDDCSYCRKYRPNEEYDCNRCELRVGDITFSCGDGLWLRLRKSKTWGTWVKRAKLVREYIRKNG